MSHITNLKFGQLFLSEAPSAPLVILNTFEGEGQEVYDAVRSITDKDFSLAAITVPDWDRDMSPWKSKAVFKGEKDFEGKADDFMKRLSDEYLPVIREHLNLTPSATYIAGYSMAGMFALYSLFICGIFDGAASISGSLWYPGFTDHITKHEPLSPVSKIYISLGDRESHTRNQVMATVEENTRSIAKYFMELGIDTAFEMNEGNHFKDPALRTAKGIARLLEDRK